VFETHVLKLYLED